jgi:predicted Zn-ribbon and HTH transcriptional regulator
MGESPRGLDTELYGGPTKKIHGDRLPLANPSISGQLPGSRVTGQGVNRDLASRKQYASLRIHFMGLKIIPESSTPCANKMKIRLPRCPDCGAEISKKDIRVGSPFLCPHCRAALQPSEGYAQIVFWGPIIVSFLGSFLLGLRGYHLASASLAGSLLLVPLSIGYLKYVIPPTIGPELPKDSNLRLK